LIAEFDGAARLRGEIAPPPDKSISHRAAMFAALARGRSVIRNYLRAADTLSTLGVLRALGVEMEVGNEIVIRGRGLEGLMEPSDVLDCGNSGTTMRLMSGILSGNPFFSVLTGDDSLRGRPMGRIITPLKKMCAEMLARADKYPPLAIRGGGLKPISYEMPMSSAQVKSSVLLAGLFTEGVTEVSEPVKSRDHTERMLPAFGADLKVDGLKVSVRGRAELRGMDFSVPGDFSSAAFFIAAGVLVKDSDITLRAVNINPTRTGFLEALKGMGASVAMNNVSDVSGEPVADLRISRSELKAISIGSDMLPSMIDEFPIFCVVASQAEGVTSIRGAGELRVKESDRIKAMAEGLRRMGAEVEEHEDGLSIKGPARLKGAAVESHKDHRIAMALAVAALVAEGKTAIRDAESADISFPGFFDKLRGLVR
jgi:3-phosphoshikimate 1-carboxyvinyltransferase